MIDAGIFEPASATGTTREGSTTILDRLTTSDEQRMQAVERAGEVAAEVKKDADLVRIQVVWTRGDPTVLEIPMSVEHFDGQRVWIPDTTAIREFTLDGGEIQHDESSRLRQLQDEVVDLHERGML
jgi:hypothetical protein